MAQGRLRRALTTAGLIWLAAGPAARAQQLRAADLEKMPAAAPVLTAQYGPDPLETGELRLPPGKGPFPVAVVIHGGCWTKGFATLHGTAALASALAAKGIATWNIEYRQVGDAGGGWPGTFQDWGAATDYLRVLAKTQPIDLGRVMTVGHSAGAHAALWVAARHRLPPESAIRGAAPLPIRTAVAIDGPGELEELIGRDARICGKPVIEPLMGASPAKAPSRYFEATPAALLPLGVREALVAAAVLTSEDAHQYRAKAEAAGDRIGVLDLAGRSGHFEVIAPDTAQGQEVVAFIVANTPAAEPPAR